MRLADETYEYIKSEVCYLFERYDIRCVPISGFEIAIKMGIILVSYNKLSPRQLLQAQKISFDGFYIEPGNGKEYIFYNDRIGYERSNMTILHEIGHCVLGHTDDMDSEVVEAEACFFAKYCAAPPPLVHTINPKTPEEIADKFYISYEAACFAFRYYHNWLRFHHAYGRFTEYEKKLLHLFQFPA